MTSSISFSQINNEWSENPTPQLIEALEALATGVCSENGRSIRLTIKLRVMRSLQGLIMMPAPSRFHRCIAIAGYHRCHKLAEVLSDMYKLHVGGQLDGELLKAFGQFLYAEVNRPLP